MAQPQSTLDQINSYDLFAKNAGEGGQLGGGHVCLKRTIIVRFDSSATSNILFSMSSTSLNQSSVSADSNSMCRVSMPSSLYVARDSRKDKAYQFKTG